jgi:hypothetical protein
MDFLIASKLFVKCIREEKIIFFSNFPNTSLVIFNFIIETKGLEFCSHQLIHNNEE